MRQPFKEHKSLFLRVIQDVNYVFGEHSFRRYDPEQGWEKVVNKSIYDVITLYFAHLESEKIREKKDDVIMALKEVCQDADFNEAIASATSGTGRVQTRLDKWHQALLNVGFSVEKIRIGQYTENEV